MERAGEQTNNKPADGGILPETPVIAESEDNAHAPAAPISPAIAIQSDGTVTEDNSFGGLSPTFHSGEQLRTKMWKTIGARFNAARRLRAMHRWSLTAVSALSAYVIIVTALPVFVPLNITPTQQGWLNFALMGMAIFILVLSLLESSNSYELRAERLHDCATEISQIRNELELRLYSHLTLSVEQISEYQQRYDDTIRRCRENHEPIDYQFFETKHPKDFQLTFLQKTFRTLIYYIKPRAFYLSMIAFPLLLALIAVF